MMDIKKEIKDGARLARGLSNALGYEVDYINADVDNWDLLCMGESIRETKHTTQRLLDNLTELEYLLYLLKNAES